MQILFFIYMTIFGLCFGSFANVVIYRLPRNMSIVKPPSHCPNCNKRLAGTDLLPVISFIFLKGRCRYCKKKISVRYPLIEASCGLLFCVTAAFTGISLSVIPLCLLAFVLLCVSVIDADTQKIPDGLLIFGAAAAIMWVIISNVYPVFSELLAAPLWYEALLGALTGALPLFVIDRATILLVKKDGFGFGDVKLMAMAGLFIGWKLVLVAFFFAFVIGGCYAGFLLATHRAEKGTYLAFGPFLSAGVIIALLFGHQFILFLL